MFWKYRYTCIFSAGNLCCLIVPDICHESAVIYNNYIQNYHNYQIYIWLSLEIIEGKMCCNFILKCAKNIKMGGGHFSRHFVFEFIFNCNLVLLVNLKERQLKCFSNFLWNALQNNKITFQETFLYSDSQLKSVLLHRPRIFCAREWPHAMPLE